MMFGREIRLPIECELGLPPQTSLSQNDYVRKLQKTLIDTFASVRKRMGVVQKRQKAYFDASAHGSPYSVGKTVYLANHTATGLEMKWIGPYIIQEVRGKVYRIKPVDGA